MSDYIATADDVDSIAESVEKASWQHEQLAQVNRAHSLVKDRVLVL